MEKNNKVKRCSLNLSTKISILREVDKKTQTKGEIAKKFKIPPSTLSTIIKDREKIEASAEGANLKSKKLRGATHSELEAELFEFFTKFSLNLIL